MKILQTPTFARQVKKLHNNQKKDLDRAIEGICIDPLIGEMKKGDLAGIRFYKFKMVGQLTLLAYQSENNELLMLLMLGSHENFYKDLKK